MVGASLLVGSDERRSLDDDEYWPDQLVGLEVRVDGQQVGTIGEVIMGPQTRLGVVMADQTEFQVPFVADLVPTVDLAAGYVEIVMLDGLVNPR